MKNEIVGTICSFGKFLEDAAKQTMQHTEEVQESENALQMQKMQESLAQQIEELKINQIEVWLNYLQEEKGITVGFGENGNKVQKLAGNYCIVLPSSVDGIALETDLNNLCKYDKGNFSNYLQKKEREALFDLNKMQQRYTMLAAGIERKRQEIHDLEEEYCVAMEFSARSQKKRMANVCLEKIDRLELTKIEVAEKIREINETYKRFAMCLSDFNRWKIRSVRYNRDSKNKILVIIVE